MRLQFPLRALAGVIGFATSAWAQTVALQMQAPITNDDFGAALVSLGDVNGDGVSDVLIASDPYASSTGLWVYDGKTGLPLYSVPLISFVLAPIGDIDGDGIPDFLNGVPFEDWGVQSAAGAMYAYSGANGALLHEVQGKADNENYGVSAAAFSDWNHDGVVDYLVGSVGPTPVNALGAVTIASGVDGSPLAQFSGQSFAEYFGSQVADIGDLDHDGFEDFVEIGNGNLISARAVSTRTGATLWSVASLGSYGSWGVTLSVRSDLDGDGVADLVIGLTSSVQVRSGASGALLYEVQHDCANGAHGWCGDTIADRDGDGVDELIVLDRALGRLDLVSGASGTIQSSVFDHTLEYPSRWLNIAPFIDVDGDGRQDWLVGMPNYGNGFPNFGRVQVWTDTTQPLIGTPQTFGDGSGTPCPCGNIGQLGAGCANSTGFGATIAALGSTSIADDKLHVHSNHVPVGHTAVLFSGTKTQNHGLGTPFGDGLSGIGGTLKRLQTKTTCALEQDWGPVELFAFANAGSTRYLQLWYRDNVGPCGSGINLSNAVSVTFTP